MHWVLYIDIQVVFTFKICTYFCVVFAPHLYVFSCCQVLLADEQSTVRAVKRQQFKMFDDQYKFGDDLSQYVLCMLRQLACKSFIIYSSSSYRGVSYGTAQMYRRTRSRSQNANALTIANQRGVALVSLASIHSTRNEINTRERNGCHAPLIGDYSSTCNRLSRECATLHLSGTVHM